LLGIERGQLQHFAILNVADAHVVVEINRTRRAGGDAVGLNTGSRENQDLRVGVDTEFLEQGGQIARARRVVEFDLAACKALRETPHGIGGLTGVLDGGMIQREEDGVFEAIRQEPGGASEESGARGEERETCAAAHSSYDTSRREPA
jgi:hypothetical protein